MVKSQKRASTTRFANREVGVGKTEAYFLGGPRPEGQGRGRWWYGGSGTRCRIGGYHRTPENATVGSHWPRPGRDEGTSADRPSAVSDVVQHICDLRLFPLPSLARSRCAMPPVARHATSQFSPPLATVVAQRERTSHGLRRRPTDRRSAGWQTSPALLPAPRHRVRPDAHGTIRD